jgi:hypothetical protein
MAGLHLPERPSDLPSAAAIIHKHQLAPAAGAAEALREKDAAGRESAGRSPALRGAVVHPAHIADPDRNAIAHVHDELVEVPRLRDPARHADE